MKRCRAGAVLLLVLLLGGWLTGGIMHRRHSFCVAQMEQAAAAALDGSWENALRLTALVQIRWEKDRDPAAVLTDHAPLDEIDSLLRQLQPAAAARNGPGYAGICLQLAQIWEALARDHRPGLTDIF